MHSKKNVVNFDSRLNQFNAQWLAMLHDMVHMAIDRGDYSDELLDFARERIEGQTKELLRPENEKLVAPHRKYDPQSY